jgi:HSP20 family protein
MVPAVRNNGSLLPATPVNRLASLFDRFFHDDIFTPQSVTWPSLALLMWEDEHYVFVEVDTPGMTEKDVELSVDQNELVIKGERKCERQEGGYDTRCYGQFEQRINLPSPVEADKTEARIANGVLKITFAKSEASKPRRIALKSE